MPRRHLLAVALLALAALLLLVALIVGDTIGWWAHSTGVWYYDDGITFKNFRLGLFHASYLRNETGIETRMGSLASCACGLDEWRNIGIVTFIFLLLALLGSIGVAVAGGVFLYKPKTTNRKLLWIPAFVACAAEVIAFAVVGGGAPRRSQIFLPSGSFALTGVAVVATFTAACLLLSYDCDCSEGANSCLTS